MSRTNGHRNGKNGKNGKKNGQLKKCIWCETLLEGKQQRFCSKSCKNKFGVSKRRHQSKLKAIAYKGGKCEKCGYDQHRAALTFHHVDPKQKSFPISSIGLTRKWTSLKKELDKCILLCSNCHHILHYEEHRRDYIDPKP